MSGSFWGYIPKKCDGEPCIGDCDLCSKAEEKSCRSCRFWEDTRWLSCSSYGTCQKYGASREDSLCEDYEEDDY